MNTKDVMQKFEIRGQGMKSGEAEEESKWHNSRHLNISSADLHGTLFSSYITFKETFCIIRSKLCDHVIVEITWKQQIMEKQSSLISPILFLLHFEITLYSLLSLFASLHFPCITNGFSLPIVDFALMGTHWYLEGGSLIGSNLTS